MIPYVPDWCIKILNLFSKHFSFVLHALPLPLKLSGIFNSWIKYTLQCRHVTVLKCPWVQWGYYEKYGFDQYLLFCKTVALLTLAFLWLASEGTRDINWSKPIYKASKMTHTEQKDASSILVLCTFARCCSPKSDVRPFCEKPFNYIQLLNHFSKTLLAYCFMALAQQKMP